MPQAQKVRLAVFFIFTSILNSRKGEKQGWFQLHRVDVRRILKVGLVMRSVNSSERSTGKHGQR